MITNQDMDTLTNYINNYDSSYEDYMKIYNELSKIDIEIVINKYDNLLSHGSKGSIVCAIAVLDYFSSRGECQTLLMGKLMDNYKKYQKSNKGVLYRVLDKCNKVGKESKDNVLGFPPLNVIISTYIMKNNLGFIKDNIEYVLGHMDINDLARLSISSQSNLYYWLREKYPTKLDNNLLLKAMIRKGNVEGARELYKIEGRDVWEDDDVSYTGLVGNFKMLEWCRSIREYPDMGNLSSMITKKYGIIYT